MLFNITMGIACSLFVAYRLDVNQISRGVTWYYLDIQLHKKKVINTKSQCYTTSPCACISMMPRSDKHIWLELNTKRSPLVLCRYTASQEDRQKRSSNPVWLLYATSNPVWQLYGTSNPVWQLYGTSNPIWQLCHARVTEGCPTKC